MQRRSSCERLLIKVLKNCSRLAQRVLDQLEEDLTAALQEKLEQSRQQLERTQQELSALAERQGTGSSRKAQGTGGIALRSVRFDGRTVWQRGKGEYGIVRFRPRYWMPCWKGVEVWERFFTMKRYRGLDVRFKMCAGTRPPAPADNANTIKIRQQSGRHSRLRIFCRAFHWVSTARPVRLK